MLPRQWKVSGDIITGLDPESPILIKKKRYIYTKQVESHNLYVYYER